MKLSKTLARALLAAACSTFLFTACGTALDPVRPVQPAQAPARAADVAHGVVRSIEIVDAPAPVGATGAVLGGLAGGILGHQIGDGGGRTAATIAGAVGGAFLGNRIEQRQRAAAGTRIYRVRVEFDNGATQNFEFRELDGLKVGDRVRHENGVLARG